ncbi:MAG: type IIL restriction-modification enzyme MmeI [Opitutaceae bacterium]
MDAVDVFIDRWAKAEAAERANYQMFLSELCDVLAVPRPDPTGPDNAFNRYVFDRSITRAKHDGTTTTVYADLYKRGCFILETKQGAHAKGDNPDQLGLLGEDPVPYKTGHGIRGTKQWDLALEKAYNQARGYIRDLPAAEGRPPFLIVCDVGYVIELYSEFTCTGGTYLRFPDPKTHRIFLDDLRRPEIRERLRAVWTDPASLDPGKHAARVTRDVAAHLAKLAESLEVNGHDPQAIATFLQRCLFTLFAEDTGLLPKGAFLDLLRKVKDSPQGFVPLITQLWKDMATGTDYSTVLLQKIAHFNGGLFENAVALPLDGAQIAFLLGAAKPDWSDVEPAIFGTLLERALSPRDRHKLGAHYTPRSYVERLVKPTIIDPLRARWDNVRLAAAQHESAGQRAAAIADVRAFHHELCRLRVLDPACGSGNFLYVTLEHLKRLEGEVLELLETLGDTELTFEMEHFKVRPQQFFGLEINAQAVAIAQLVLWIGYFQWHKKTTGQSDTGDRPLLPKEQTIRAQDAVLAYDAEIPRKDAAGNFITIWDGRTTKPHPVTGREVPDETARIPVYDYTNPRRAEWPAADYIVGNPPFIGARTNRQYLGDGYLQALRGAYSDIPANIDFVMYWWQRAALLLERGEIKRFGFITSKSIAQSFNQVVVEKILDVTNPKLRIDYAIPNHPWVDSVDGAQVRIAMTVLCRNHGTGILDNVSIESESDEYGEYDVSLDSQVGLITPDLKIGLNTFGLNELMSNSMTSCVGYQLTGTGFAIDSQTASRAEFVSVSHPLLSARDITQNSRGLFAIDVSTLDVESLLESHPAVYQHLVNNVKPERNVNSRKSVREKWWVYGEPRFTYRPALEGIKRQIVTPLTSKHRIFTFCSNKTVADSTTVLFALEDGYELSLLSSFVHVRWALAVGGRMGVGDDPRYNKTRCFETFPFPDLPESNPLKAKIRELGEQLDAHRKRQQAAHPDLTLTGLYNIVEKLRREEPLTDKERKVHDNGLAAVLKQLHDELDDAVLAAYGWSDLATKVPLADRLARGDDVLEQAILTRLVALNHERAAEEAKGHIRWLRPDYQNPQGTTATKPDQSELDVATTTKPAPTGKLPWPTTLPDKVAILRTLLPTTGPDAAALASHFGKRTKSRLTEITQILDTLRSLGQL